MEMRLRKQPLCPDLLSSDAKSRDAGLYEVPRLQVCTVHHVIPGCLHAQAHMQSVPVSLTQPLTSLSHCGKDPRTHHPPAFQPPVLPQPKQTACNLCVCCRDGGFEHTFSISPHQKAARYYLRVDCSLNTQCHLFVRFSPRAQN